MKKVFKLLALTFFIALMTTFLGCKKDTENPINRIPILITADISGITKNSVVTGGNISYDGGDEITERGVCWSRDLYPTTEDEKVTNGSGSGSFTCNLTDLNPRTTYFVRAYAITGAGVTYGNQLSFTTQETGTFPGGVQYSGAAGFSIGSKVYLGLGYYDNLPVKDFWEWNKITNVWTRKADYPGNSAGYAVCFSIGTKGYIGFGNDLIDGATNEFWEYDPSTNSWTKKASPPPSVGNAVGFSIGNKGYIGTGYIDPYKPGSYREGYYNDLWEWDQETNIWTKKASFAGISRYSAVGFSIGNKGYIGAGTVDGRTLFNDFWEWDEAINNWKQAVNF